jgi:glycosyltransferase involved in cell wall biosynthesis
MAIRQKELGITKVAFFTVVHPHNEKFLLSFLNSLNNQTYKKFDLVVVNDGLKNFRQFINDFSNLNFIELNSGYSHIKNREIGINYCIKKKYNFLIFGDSDDYFDSNRIETSIKLLKKNDIIINDVSTFNKNGIIKNKYFSNRLNNYQTINFDFIEDKNIFGLSNTALNLKNLSILEFPNDIIALDWYIFSIFLINGKKAIFTNDTLSYYRQHKKNFVGLKKIDIASFKKGLDIKIAHYKAMSKFNINFKTKLEMIYKRKFTTKDIKFPLWWEQI